MLGTATRGSSKSIWGDPWFTGVHGTLQSKYGDHIANLGIGVILRLYYWYNGKENGNYYVVTGYIMEL